MKKFIILSLFGLLIMGFSTTVSAQVDFKGSAFMAAGFIFERNIFVGIGDVATFTGTRPVDFPGEAADWNRPKAYWESYSTLRFDASVEKAVTGVMLFEMIDYRAGQWFGGYGYSAPTFDNGLWNGKLAQIRVLNLYFDFALPYMGIPVPMNVRIGKQQYGVRPFFFLNNNGVGVTGSIKADPVNIALMYGKMAEPKDATSNDSNMYGADISAKLGNISAGTFLFDFRMKDYPLNNNQGVQPDSTLTFAYGVSPNFKADMWYWGLYADGKAGPLNFNFDFVLDNGRVKPYVNTVGDVPSVKYSGWVAQLKFNYPIQKFTLGGLGLYSTGPDMRKTGVFGYPGEPAANGGALTTKVGTFVSPPGSEAFVLWAESMFLGGDFGTLISGPLMMGTAPFYQSDMTRSAFGGTWIAKLFGSYQATPWYKVTLQGLYIGDTAKHGNTMGDAVDASGNLRDDKTIGWEFGLINNIMIYKNLHLTVEGGYLLAGKALDQNIWGTNRNGDLKDPYVVSTCLVCFF
jgi:hypothetical protein